MKEPGPAACVCYFAVTKLQPKRLKEGKAYLGHSVRTQSIVQRRCGHRSRRLGSPPTHSQEAERGVQLSFSFILKCKNSNTISWLGVPPPVTLIYTVPHRLAQRFVASVTLDPVKLQSLLSPDPTPTPHNMPSPSLAPLLRFRPRGFLSKMPLFPEDGPALSPTPSYLESWYLTCKDSVLGYEAVQCLPCLANMNPWVHFQHRTHWHGRAQGRQRQESQKHLVTHAAGKNMLEVPLLFTEHLLRTKCCVSHW